MYEKELPNGNIEVHTTVKEFSELYKNNSAKYLSEYYGIPTPTINLWIQKLGLRKNR